MAPSFVLALLVLVPLATATAVRRGSDSHSGAQIFMAKKSMPALSVKLPSVQVKEVKVTRVFDDADDDDDYDYHMCDGTEVDDDSVNPFALPPKAPKPTRGGSHSSSDTPRNSGIVQTIRNVIESGSRKLPTLIKDLPQIIKDNVKLPGIKREGGSDSSDSSPNGRKGKPASPVQVKSPLPLVKVDLPVPAVRPVEGSGAKRVPTLIADIPKLVVDTIKQVAPLRPVPAKEASSGRSPVVKVSQVDVKVQAPVPVVPVPAAPVVAARPVVAPAAPTPVRQGSSGRAASVKVDVVKVQAPVVPVVAVRPVAVKEASSARTPVVKVAQVDVKVQAPAPAAPVVAVRPVVAPAAPTPVKQGSSGRAASVKVDVVKVQAPVVAARPVLAPAAPTVARLVR